MGRRLSPSLSAVPNERLSLAPSRSTLYISSKLKWIKTLPRWQHRETTLATLAG